ncbi:alpha-(1,3)-fucosyltransferase C-like [Plodia interpunctella]|uniref:alpha-(1,3)-fucosyltransferase C-like n=1 Tax=Plodia interpunctella TaxID=58824 RepID=UPI002368E281|nr:alpha-(1,3)-fucosyltransferase C-like [Plodia interpunctella]
MKRNILGKLFGCILSLSIFWLWYNIYHRTILEIIDTRRALSAVINKTKSGVILSTKPSKLKYILQWTKPENVPFVYMGVGQNTFFENKCKYTNCYVTSNRYYLEHYTLFDVIIFAGPEVVLMDDYHLPAERSSTQKYVFATIESSQFYPVCSYKFDGYFNWTWSFRLDSESRWGYIVIRDKKNKIIGPNKVMHWMKLEDMEPVSEEFKMSLKTKTKAVAWFVSNCFSRSRRELVARRLGNELAKYSLTVDVYGQCGFLSCPRDNEQKCEDMIKKTYYFYLAFENSFSEDYVTEKILHGLKNNAIPIVYGAANYTRFMPEGIYLNAAELSVETLAMKINELINNPEKYVEYFKWTNYYTYHRRNDNSETNDYCSMCALLNNEDMLTKKSVKENFRQWWDSPAIC